MSLLYEKSAKFSNLRLTQSQENLKWHILTLCEDKDLWGNGGKKRRPTFVSHFSKSNSNLVVKLQSLAAVGITQEIATVCSSFNPINEGGGRSVPGLQRGDLLATHGHAHIMLVEDLMLALAVSASLSLSPLFCLCRSSAHRRTHATRYV